MLKTTQAAGPRNKNLQQDDHGIQVDNQDEKKPTQKVVKANK